VTHLDYLKQNAISTREWEDGKFVMYRLSAGIAVYNNHNNKYLWYANPQPGR